MELMYGYSLSELCVNEGQVCVCVTHNVQQLSARCINSSQVSEDEVSSAWKQVI